MGFLGRAVWAMKYVSLVAFFIVLSCCVSCHANARVNRSPDEEVSQLRRSEAWDQRFLDEDAVPNFRQLYLDDIIEALKRKTELTSQEKIAQQLKRLGNRNFNTQGWKRKREVGGGRDSSSSSALHHTSRSTHLM